MSGTVNKVILVARLARDPETRSSQDGKSIVTLSVATNETWKDKSTGERREKAEFHRVVIFNENIAKVADQFLKKGSTVYIEGQLQTRKWTDKEGVEKYTTEIVLQQYGGVLTMLGKSESAGDDYQQPARKAEQKNRNSSGLGFGDDDIPFAPEFR